SNGDGTYQNSDLIVKAGSSYQLSFPYNGMTVTATTVAPAEPQGLTLSENTISIGQSAGFGGGEMPSMINVSWSNKDSSYYFIYVKNVEVVKEAINTRTEAGKDFFRNTPTNMDQYEINPRSFQYYGQHRIILYRIRPEYVLFFQDNSSSSLSITEIRANIQNGFGIFTAINSASAYLYVGKP
ncbi:MAG: DUF4249 domain-containing protein, partial [Marinilabiliales bacterium]|nr:DUF4249 domain-containing protein [Marinilabiliales bacterium]